MRLRKNFIAQLDKSTTEGNNALYEEKYYETLESYQKEFFYEYNELFYHYDREGNLDWVLAEGRSGCYGTESTQMRIAGRVISNEWAIHFCFGYGVYDVAQNQFIDLFDIRNNTESYEGLKEVLWEMKIGRPVGDADNDGELTVLDATAIQRKLANLQSSLDLEKNIYYNSYYLELGSQEGDRVEHDYADYDDDGVLSVIDATRIQKHLAGLE